jgi:hypothetical protein
MLKALDSILNFAKNFKDIIELYYNSMDGAIISVSPDIADFIYKISKCSILFCQLYL